MATIVAYNMARLLNRIGALVLLFVCLVNTSTAGKGGFYSYKVTDIKGKEISLEKYRGKVSGYRQAT